MRPNTFVAGERRGCGPRHADLPLPFGGESSDRYRRAPPAGVPARVRHRPDRRGADRRDAVLGALGRGDRGARRAGDLPGRAGHRHRAGRSRCRSCSGCCSASACWPTNSGTAWPPGCSACRWSGSGCTCWAGSPSWRGAPFAPGRGDHRRRRTGRLRGARGRVLARRRRDHARHRRLVAGAAAGPVEPGDRGVQPAARAAAGRRPGAAGRRLEGVRQSARRHHRGRDRWLCDRRGARRLGGAAAARCRVGRAAARRDRRGDGVVRRGRRGR